MKKVGKRMQKGNFDFNDFMLQAQAVRKMGGLSSMLKLMPGGWMGVMMMIYVCVYIG